MDIKECNTENVNSNEMEQKNVNSRREEIVEMSNYDSLIFFDSPEYDGAIVGVSNTGQIIYDYDKMLDCLVEDGTCEDHMEAADFVSYNTLRALDYNPDPDKPIVMFTFYC